MLLLGVGSLAEVFVLRHIYSKTLRGYILAASILFFAVALQEKVEFFHYALAIIAVATTIFKGYLFWLIKKSGQSLQQQRYLADINLTSWLLAQKVKEVTPDVDPDHQDFVFKSGTTKNGLLKIHYDGTILFVNKTFADYVGSTTKDLIGTNYKEYLIQEDVAKSEEIWASHKGGILYGFVNRWIVNGKMHNMRWYTCENDDESQVAKCVLHVWP